MDRSGSPAFRFLDIYHTSCHEHEHLRGNAIKGDQFMQMTMEHKKNVLISGKHTQNILQNHAIGTKKQKICWLNLLKMLLNVPME